MIRNIGRDVNTVFHNYNSRARDSAAAFLGLIIARDVQHTAARA